MLSFDMNSFVFFARETKRLAMVLEKETQGTTRTPEQKTNDRNIISSYYGPFKLAGLEMCCTQINKILHACREDGVITTRDLGSMIGELSNRMEDECKSKVFLSLSPREAEFFSPTEPLFGVDFASKFPGGGAFELDEAAKCLALGRATAAVFHLMRVMEIGIRALSKCLNIPDPIQPSQRNWGRILTTIKEQGIDQKWPTAAAKTLAGAEIFDELHASLDAVKNPWRNATMHVENKYTYEEAEHIFFSVKGFMKKLASRMDEEGSPKA
ncbi:MAG: hypothetical protein KGM47_15275 [Acidobacteriota bacterium]|nr:hypothetical protein [Acidobacteriota bacterium]